jgi:exopolyphosphatase/guanosine-5'-triphosphate,3'-diphosphate pyrophosphatase
MKEDEGRDLEAYFDQTYLPLTEAVAIYKPEVLAGSAGSFETLMDVLQMDMKADVIPLTENAYELPIIPAKKCIEMLVHSTRAKREQLKGLVAFRMEMIASAALMTGWVLKKFEMNRIITSLYSLKEGALLDA